MHPWFIRSRWSKPHSTPPLHALYRSYHTERVIEPLVLASEIESLPDLEGYCNQPGKVVKIAFRVPERRTVAPDLIERLIPGAPKRALDPEPAAPRHTSLTPTTQPTLF